MKRLTYLIAGLAVAGVAFAQGAPAKGASKDSKPADAAKTAQAAQPAKPAAGVNWEGQIVKATGSGAPDIKATTPAQARLGAERVAKLDAFRQLLEQVKGVQISSGKKVGDAMGRDEIKSKVEGAIRGFKVTATRYFNDGGVEVDVEVPLAAIASLVMESAAVEVKLAVKSEGEAKNTGLVVDARGLKVTPALAPRLVDSKGKALYAVEILSDDARKSSGVAGYVANLDDAMKSMRVGDKPLLIKAQKSEGTDLVLSDDEAKKLAENNNAYLAEGRVLIVTN